MPRPKKNTNNNLSTDTNINTNINTINEQLDQIKQMPSDIKPVVSKKKITKLATTTNATKTTNRPDQPNQSNQPNQPNQPNQLNQLNQLNQPNQTNQADPFKAFETIFGPDFGSNVQKGVNTNSNSITNPKTNTDIKPNKTKGRKKSNVTNSTSEINQTDATKLTNEILNGLGISQNNFGTNTMGFNSADLNSAGLNAINYMGQMSSMCPNQQSYQGYEQVNTSTDPKYNFASLRKQIFGPKYKEVGRTEPDLDAYDKIIMAIMKKYSTNGKLKTNHLSDDKIDDLFNKICSKPVYEEEDYDPDEGILDGFGKYFTITTGQNNELLTDKKQIVSIINSVYDTISNQFFQLHKELNELPKTPQNEEKRKILFSRFLKLTKVLSNLLKYRGLDK
jgi:hypothetical protein